MRHLLPCLLALVFATRLTAADVDFNRDVLPILSDHCFACHGPDAAARKADLRLDAHKDALAAITPGKSGDSELIRRVVTDDAAEKMPPAKSKRTLTAKQIDTLKRWVDSGAKWGKHWSFEPPTRPPVPKAKHPTRNPVDAFLFARLEKDGLAPSAEASKETLIRRVTLDLTGLPPTPAEVDAFLKDQSPRSFETVVDRLLASPHYGERMAWEWLDAGRYADSNGYQGDTERTMWPWRDWAVNAFNENVPYDRFTLLQLAGDLLPKAGVAEKLPTGFLRNHPINGEGGRIPEENRVDYVMDMTETVGTVWLGLTLNCCRCHDHKFDPVLQREYYQLFAFFNQTPVTGGGRDGQQAPVVELTSPADSARLAALKEKAATAAKAVETAEAGLFPRAKGKPASDSDKAKGLPKDVLDVLKLAVTARSKTPLGTLLKHFGKEEPDYAELLKALSDAVSARDEFARQVPRVMVMEEMPQPRDSFIYQKGLYTKPGTKVSVGFPQAIGGSPAPKNRADLAKWLTSKGNPLTARVTVNRLWQQLFGVGLVKTVEDFGVQGERPVHPELLDWLAVEFRDTGWDVKRFVKLLVTSAAYRQSSKVTPALLERDPENRLLARGPRYRLPSWVLRDQALAASGLLVPTVGGPPVRPYQPAGIWEEATFGQKQYKQDHGDALYRRSLYTFWRRIVGPTMFFDTAARQVCAVKASRTNTPLHALLTLNETTYVEASRALAERAMKAEQDDAKRVRFAYRRVLARSPSAEEETVLLGALTRLRKQYGDDPAAAKKLLAVGESKRDEQLDVTEHAAFAALCGLVLNLDEALSKE